MDHLISTFSRIVRKIDTPDTIRELLAQAEADSSSLLPADADRLLDVPDPETVNTQIAAITTSLSRTTLATKARDDPSTLTSAEVALLARRYWPEEDNVQMVAERAVRTRAGEAVLALPAGRAQWDNAVARLGRLRIAVRPDEADALEKADWEVSRRAREARRVERERENVEGVLRRARPWVRRLWEEDLQSGAADPRRRWGFAVFVQPAADDEEYRARRDAMLFHATGAICCGDVIGARWRFQELEWPEDEDEDAKEGDAVDQIGSVFQRLRKEFADLRDEPKEGSGGSLADGLLRNTVCVADRESIASIMAGSGNVDDMWVWALDPDYDEAKSSTKKDTETGLHDDGYKGYLKVRLQQLVNNFFEARRFRAKDYTMKDLWTAARQSKGHAFVSIRPEEAGQWTMDRTVGSALRPSN